MAARVFEASEPDTSYGRDKSIWIWIMSYDGCKRACESIGRMQEALESFGR